MLKAHKEKVEKLFIGIFSFFSSGRRILQAVIAGIRFPLNNMDLRLGSEEQTDRLGAYLFSAGQRIPQS